MDYIVVENIPRWISNSKLLKYFAKYGNIEAVARNDNRYFTGTATLKFPDETAADEAIAYMDGANLDGFRLSVTRMSNL